MKKLILFIALIALSLSLAYAQSTFGVKGGLNISHIAGDDALASSDPLVGVHGGVMLQFHLMPSLIFQPEFIYTQKGHSYKYNAADVYTKHAVSLDYLELPLLLKLNVVAGTVKIQPYAGATISYLIGARDKRTVSSTNTSTTTSYNINSQMKDLAAGIALGGEVVIKDRYMVGGRYVFGVTNIYEDGRDTQNGVLMLNLGYLFN